MIVDVYFQEVQKMLQGVSQIRMEHILYLLEQTYYEERHIYIMGNGGSAATASHLALDLAKNTLVSGAPRVKVTALTDNTPLITAWANDADYVHIFEGQLDGVLEPGDVVIGISTSGNSQNIINALEYAKKCGGVTIALLGARGGKIKSLVQEFILAPGSCIEQEEDAHLIIAHMITCRMREVVAAYANSHPVLQ